MNGFKMKMLALVITTFAIAAVLGGSLGVATAGFKPSLGTGFNLVGGPLGGDVTPEKWVSCIPASSWRAIYIWDGQNQTWGHYFNTTKGVPSYVNDPKVGGIQTIKRFSGIVMIMDSAVSNPYLPDSASDACP